MGHYLKPNHSTRTPSSFLVFDTETTPINHGGDGRAWTNVLKLGHAIAWRTRQGKECGHVEKSFTEASGFWGFLQTRLSFSRPLWVFAHNIGFDLRVVGFKKRLTDKEFVFREEEQVLPQRMQRQGKKKPWYGWLCINDPPTIFVTRYKHGGTVIFCDLYNWFRCSLKEIGESVGLSKTEFPGFSANNSDLLAYCINDTRIVENAVKKIVTFVRENDCGVFKWTAGSQAFHAWKHLHKQPAVLHHDKQDVYDLERDSYFGGECRLFRRGKVDGPVYVVDCSSFYPAIMHAMDMPVALRGHTEHGSLQQLELLVPSWHCVARCLLSTAKATFPIRDKTGVHHCTGKFWTVLTGGELAYALSKHLICKVSELAWYSRANLFRAFVDKFWRLRLLYKNKQEVAMERLCKLLLNSLYGKFGQLSPEWVDLKGELCEEPWDRWPEVDSDGQTIAEYRSVGYHVQKREKQVEASYSSPIISAWITSAGRQRMKKLRWLVGEENCLYQDTDSLHLTDRGFARFCKFEPILLDELGSFKLEGVYKEAEYLGQRHYRLDNEWIVAGIPSKSEYLGDGKWDCLEFSRLDTLTLPGDQSGVEARRTIKKTVLPRIGGVITSSNSVIPIDLGRGKKFPEKGNKSLDLSI